MCEYAGVVCSIWAYDAGDVDDIDGVAVVWRTRFTSFRASSDQRSTFRTYIVCSISLSDKYAPGQLQPKCSVSVRGRWSTYLQSISFPVLASLTMSLTQGGGVMGRRSYPAVSPQSHPTTRNLEPRKTSVPCHRSHTSAHVAAVAQHPGCRNSD
jgi:hypothetical protein